MDEHFDSNGTVWLRGIQIGSVLQCSKGSFHGNGAEALVCDGAVINGDVFLDRDFNAFGEVRLSGAQLGGSLNCKDAFFSEARSLDDTPFNRTILNRLGNPPNGVLTCDGVMIRGSVFLIGKFFAGGTVRLLGAKIDGDLDCHGATLLSSTNGIALYADGMEVTGAFHFYKLMAVKGIVSLFAVKVGSLSDDANSLSEVELRLNGFIYGSLAGISPTDAKTRIEWLDKQSASHKGLVNNGKYFKPQPWQQLQKVLREMGHIEDARQVGIKFEERLLEANLIGQPPENWDEPMASMYRCICRIFHCLFGWLIGYGYRPLSLFFKMIFVWLACGVFYWCVALYGDNGNGVFAPSNPLIFQNTEYAACVPNSCDSRVEKIKLAHAEPNEVLPPNNTVIDSAHYIISFTESLSNHIRKLFDIFRTNSHLSIDRKLVVDSEYATCLAKIEKSKLNNTPPVKGAGNWYLCEKLREEYTGFSPLTYSLDLILPLVDLQQEHDWSAMIPTPKNSILDEFSAFSLKHITRLVTWFEILFGWMASLLLVAVVSGLTKRREE